MKLPNDLFKLQKILKEDFVIHLFVSKDEIRPLRFDFKGRDEDDGDSGPATRPKQLKRPNRGDYIG